ncbi:MULTISPECIES: F510_1955 family glycosylhydrolase [unclassified Rhodococcus (in: high G+C Gram-positive bacteria)]|uniref:F510_1955 family glycosylhydrolase n=1 Tax=unclassified Rhodococcus (in: high G+C Gram-positive bacteria) TaxID=192944 RepID=UPI00163B1105|nr:MULTISPECIES: exo-alpha-sialidase [unclassified Rhodococcus (in: high G+C Gram-positive bacteria)]MBC2644851.1 exo-alpha-sialidase [Rhodococcus sp. 3A]MBC2890852.1 exo-alpha-sialidase [Rhodococcus sp. 4CII]
MPANRIARTLFPTGIAALLVLAGCSSGADETTKPDAAVPVVELRSELSHLHGLHVGDDGTVLAGTHTGLFTIDTSGATSRVGASDDDFMGLTGVPNTDTVFASGHPSASSFAANPLGLRSSTDGGTSWMDRSLAGQVDFHALTTDGRLLVGFDGTDGLLVSTDGGTTWTPGARLVAAALAINASGVWAVTPAGLEHSTTAARTFSPVPNAPRLVMIAGAGDALWGVDGDGYAWRSRDGQDWQKRSLVGTVDALTAANYDTAYAATSRSLYTLN